jgi:hypothetical protein
MPASRWWVGPANWVKRSLESWTTSCISNTFDCENASVGSEPDWACPFTNAFERTQLRKSWRLFQIVKTT